MASESTENYLKSIYHLNLKGRVTTSLLSETLQVSAPSVSEMLKKLAEDGLAIYTPYKGVELTEGGHRRALKIIRRHRLWEMFLTKFLSYSWDEVHDEAERLEHVTSDEMERRLDSTLGYPTEDPHGDPIPTAQGELSPRNSFALSLSPAGERVRILRVSDRDPALLQHAARLGLSLNTSVLIKEKRSFDGSMVLEVGAREEFISRQLASSIFVEPA